jgi:hypothetical protein
MLEPTFREPVFVRNDETTEIRASVIAWNRDDYGFSIRIAGRDESVLINPQDWDAIKRCIDRELNRVGAFDGVAA